MDTVITFYFYIVMFSIGFVAGLTWSVFFDWIFHDRF